MQTIGKKGEEAAAHYLSQKGFEILDRNYRFKRSEIDIICLKNDLMVFVEVKTRTSNFFGYPETFVSENQQRSILLAANEYIEAKNWKGGLRFDIIAILEKQGRAMVEHFKDAFY
jgi:putative endonuclease